MKYKKGYKYQLVEDFKISVKYAFPEITGQYYDIISNTISVKKGYCWDGCSGPTIDTKSNMIAGLVHDILYQALREFPESFPDHDLARRKADDILRDIMLEDINKSSRWVTRKTTEVRAWYYYHAVRRFAGYAADPKNKKKVITIK